MTSSHTRHLKPTCGGPFGDGTLSKTACAADVCFFVEVPAPRGLFGGPSATEFTSVASKRRTGERRAVDVDVGMFCRSNNHKATTRKS